MPVGGLCAGQLYLGGDGKLWHWDIFNRHIGTGDHNYAHPPTPSSPLEQDFAIEVEVGGKKVVRALDHRGFAEISFYGEYPLGFVEYRDAKLPVSVSLEAFSPFVPLDTLASSLPATVMRFTIKNTSSVRTTVRLAGWLENAIGLYTALGNAGLRRNAVQRKPAVLLVESGDHYSRSMASYGVYLAACGYEYHGPKRHLGFAPRLTPDDFRAAFTTAEGWGTFSQKDKEGARTARVEVKWGKLALKTLALLVPPGGKAVSVDATLAGTPIEARVGASDGRALITFDAEITIHTGQDLVVELTM